MIPDFADAALTDFREPDRIPSSLLADGQLVSTGLTIREGDAGTFLPKDARVLDMTPYQQATLTLRGRFGVLRLENFRKAPAVTVAYLFGIVPESQGS